MHRFDEVQEYGSHATICPPGKGFFFFFVFLFFFFLDPPPRWILVCFPRILREATPLQLSSSLFDEAEVFLMLEILQQLRCVGIYVTFGIVFQFAWLLPPRAEWFMFPTSRSAPTPTFPMEHVAQEDGPPFSRCLASPIFLGAWPPSHNHHCFPYVPRTKQVLTSPTATIFFHNRWNPDAAPRHQDLGLLPKVRIFPPLVEFEQIHIGV